MATSFIQGSKPIFIHQYTTATTGAINTKSYKRWTKAQLATNKDFPTYTDTDGTVTNYWPAAITFLNTGNRFYTFGYINMIGLNPSSSGNIWCVINSHTANGASKTTNVGCLYVQEDLFGRINATTNIIYDADGVTVATKPKLILSMRVTYTKIATLNNNAGHSCNQLNTAYYIPEGFSPLGFIGFTSGSTRVSVGSISPHYSTSLMRLWNGYSAAVTNITPYLDATFINNDFIQKQRKYQVTINNYDPETYTVYIGSQKVSPGTDVYVTVQTNTLEASKNLIPDDPQTLTITQPPDSLESGYITTWVFTMPSQDVILHIGSMPQTT